MDRSQHSAAALAAQFLSYFDKFMLKEALQSAHWTENRRADFNLWVDGVGAMAAKKASLDDRFNSKPRELALVKSLLIDLMNFLRACLSSSEASGLDEAKKGVNSAIDNLASIAVAIRQTGVKSRLLRADRTFDLHKLKDFRDNMVCLVLVQSALSNETHQECRKDKPNWWQTEINAALTPLQSRLINANLRRRNRFLYYQRHSQKLSQRQVLDILLDGELDLEEFFKEDKSKPSIEWVDSLEPNGRKGLKGRRRMAAPTLSGTSASIPESKLRWKKPQNIVQAPKSQITSIANAAIYPKLIDPLESDQNDKQVKVLKCPCCCEALPYTMLKSERIWKKHLSTDLCPYTCIATQCDLPHVLYRTRAEWEDHVKKSHASKWKCQLCSDSSAIPFSDEDDLVEHVKQTHAGSFPIDLVDSVRMWPSTPSLGLDKCPLCNSTAATDSPDLINHALEHTHNFALLSLPWADVPPKQTIEQNLLEIFSPEDLPLLDSWFNNLDIGLEVYTSAEWKSMEALLKDMLTSNIELNVNHFKYFNSNDYFADEKEESRNIGSSEAGSLQSLAVESLPSVMSSQDRHLYP